MSEPKRTKVKLPLRVYLLYLLIGTFLITGVTLSKYITASSGGDTARVASMGSLEISETGDFYDIGNKRLMLTPGVNLTKKAVVAFEGSESACYVFIDVKANGWISHDHINFSVANEKIGWSINEEWIFLQSTSENYIYYKALPPNTAINQKDIIKNGLVFVKENLKNSELAALPALSITFEAVAVQSNGFGDFPTELEQAKAAWASVSSKHS